MALDSLIVSHGYWILAVGCLLEGETVLILAGYAAHRGYLDPFWVVAVASAAGILGDQCYFWLGRRHATVVLGRWPRIAAQAERLNGLVARFHEAVIIGVRFAYGLRIAGPVLMGAGPIGALRFATFNLIGAVLWAVLVGGIGWVFGQAAESLLGKLQRIEGWLLLGAVLAVGVAWWVRRRRRSGQ